MNYCNHCGEKTTPGSNFCQNCGKPLIDLNIHNSVNADIRLETTNVATEKVFKAVGRGFSSLMDVVHKLIKPAIILAILGALIFVLVIAGYFFFEKRLKDDLVRSIHEIEQTIHRAQENVSSNNNRWKIIGVSDPASKKSIGRFATIQSNDGLCFMSVEKRVDGVELTSISCDQFKISSYSGVEILFDSDEVSYPMPINNFNNSEDVYIPSSNHKEKNNITYGGFAPHDPIEAGYQSFIKGLITANTVAIKVTPQYNSRYGNFYNPFTGNYTRDEITADPFWLNFSLKNSSDAINNLGKDLSGIQTNNYIE